MLSFSFLQINLLKVIREDWSRKENKVILLEPNRNPPLDLNLNQFHVSKFNNSISRNERDELVEQNKIFITRLTNLKKTNLNQIHVIGSNQLITKRLRFGNHNFNKAVIVRKIEIIGDDEFIVKTGNEQDHGKETQIPHRSFNVPSIILPSVNKFIIKFLIF